jgi:peptidoglycan/LPS O-acetylase OafA/YrhL
VHKNNFDFLRLLFAVFVIITHAKPLSSRTEGDWLMSLTDDQVCFSYIGVRGFFIISGFLIFQSLVRSKNLLDYFWKRVLRLFPALFVVLIVTLVLGPLWYDAAAGGGSYLQNPTVRSYFPRNFTLLLPQFAITGFFEGNPKRGSVNGSLWTIGYEFTCYAALAALYFLRQRPTWIKAILLAIWGLLFVANVFFIQQLKGVGFFLNANDLVELGIYFVGGSLLAAFDYERLRFKWAATVGAALLLVLSLATHTYAYGFQFATLPWLVIGIGTLSTPVLNRIGEMIGDLSYGIYLYSFLVMQVLVFYFKLDALPLMIIATLVSAVLGYASWHLVEKRALRLKKYQPWAGLLRHSKDVAGPTN